MIDTMKIETPDSLTDSADTSTLQVFINYVHIMVQLGILNEAACVPAVGKYPLLYYEVFGQFGSVKIVEEINMAGCLDAEVELGVSVIELFREKRKEYLRKHGPISDMPLYFFNWSATFNLP